MDVQKTEKNNKGSSINDVTLWGGQGFCDTSTKALVIESVTIRGEGSKIVKNCVILFMNNPLRESFLFKNILSGLNFVVKRHYNNNNNRTRH
jgi:hypothetical protein